MSKAKGYADEMAKYVVMGLPIPKELARNLMDELIDEYKQQEERFKAHNVPDDLEGI